MAEFVCRATIALRAFVAMAPGFLGVTGTAPPPTQAQGRGSAEGEAERRSLGTFEA